MKVSIQDLNVVSETLLLPLYFRAVESRRDNPMVKDEHAVNLVERIDYDFSDLDGQFLTQVATLMRVREFDRYTQAFIVQNPHCVVVNIGCGLDTRFFRVDNGQLEWYELDLPAVIAFRRQLLSETRRCHFIEFSPPDFSWLDTLADKRERPFLFLAEGVFMYLTEGKVKRIVTKLNQSFAGSTLIFDAVSPLQALFSHFHPALLTTKARFRWGLTHGKEVERWDKGIRLLSEKFYLDQSEPRLGLYNMWRLFPHMAKGFSIVRYRLGA